MCRLVLVVAVVLGLGMDARADSKVDWSQFIEKPGDKPLPVTHAVAAAPAPKPAPARATKVAKAFKRPAAKSKKHAARKHK
jgi:hypothetical protein